MRLAWLKTVLKFKTKRDLQASLWRIGGTLAAVLTLVMFEASLRQEKCCHSKPSSFLASMEGGVRSWVILLFPQASTARSKTGEADDTISLDSKRCFWMGPMFDRLHRRQPQDKLLLNLNYAEYFVALPPSRRKPAGGYGTISWTPLWSFGGQDRKPCERLIPDKNADDGNQPSLCAVTRKADVSAKVSQSSVHWSGHTASTATTSCPRFCFLVTPLRHHLDCSVFCDRSFQCRHRLKNGFSNRGMQCARLDTFSVDNTKIRR